MAKNITRVPVAIVLGIILLLAAACGTVDANMHITYTDGGYLRDELTLRCTGALANYLLTPEFKDGLVSGGWKVTTDVTNEATTLIATGSRRQSDNPRVSSSPVGLANGLTVTEGGNAFVKTYTANVIIPAQDMPATEQSGTSGLISQESADQMAEAMFRMSVSITLPGKIVEGNADKVQDGTATWYYTFKGLKSERRLQVTSERVLWVNIALSAAGGILGLALIAYCALRFAKARPAAVPCPADLQGKELSAAH